MNNQQFKNDILLIHVIVIAISLLACATPQNARDRGPVASYLSSKNAKQVTACVASAWESAYGITNPVNVRPTVEGYTLQVSNGYGNAFVVLDVNDTERGSTSTYYKGNVLLEGMWNKALMEWQ